MTDRSPRPSTGIRLMLATWLAVGAAALPGSAAHAATDPAAPPVDVPDTLAGVYLSARVAQVTRDLPNAARFLAEVLKSTPDDQPLQNRAFLVNLSLGRIPEALRYARQLGDTGGTARLPSLVLSLDDAKAGRYADVEKRAATLPGETMQRTIGALLTAWSEAAQGRTAEAVAALDPLGRSAELAPLQNLHIGFIQQLAGDTAAAEASFRRAMDRQSGNSFRITDALGRLLEQTGRKDDARALYQSQAGMELANAAIRRLDSGKAPQPLIANPRDGFAQAMFDLASIANQPDTQDLALLYGFLALDMNPDMPTARMLVGEILEAQGRYEDAQAMFAAVPADSALDWLARLRGAEILDRLDRTDEAIAILEKLASDQPTRAEPLVALGDLLRGHEKFADAAAAYDRAVARLPTPLKPQNWPLLYSRGISLERSGQWPRAEADFDEALVLQPDQPSVLNYLGYSWLEQNRKLPQALRLIERAVQQRPDDGSIVDSLGWAYYRLKQFDRAATFMQRAVDLRPQDATINAHYGDVLWAAGRRREARFQWSHALVFGPEADQIPLLKARLEGGPPPDPAPAADQAAPAKPDPAHGPAGTAPAGSPGQQNDGKPGRGG